MVCHNLFSQIISIDNLYQSWLEFRRGKRKNFDVQKFERKLEDNLFRLHAELKSKSYRHGKYISFYINDPKQRHIHKAEVRDRIVHHAIYRIIYPIFDKAFIYDSYSCRNGKGTHRAVKRLETFARKISKNYKGPSFALKCDVRRFFASVNHEILINLVKRRVKDKNVVWLAEEIIKSFLSPARSFPHRVVARHKLQWESRFQIKFGMTREKGMPIGNLTSQLFANIYLNKLDQFVKNELKIKDYIRYCDDFVILSKDVGYLESVCSKIESFVKKELKLELHPQKISIEKLRQGIDFLGYVALPRHRSLRTKTKKRILKRVADNNLQSYLGILRHCDGYKIEKVIKKKLEIDYN